MTTLKDIQSRVGVPTDGVWGPVTANAIAKALGMVTAPVANEPWSGKITVRMAAELISHEAIVLEWYKDSKGVGTWGIGVTNASGHNVDRYKDNPQTVARVLEIYLWLLETKYLPGVIAAMGSRVFTEAQVTAMLSFHYNTGAIKRLVANDFNFDLWHKPPEIIGRRDKERDLFYKGEWSGDGRTTIWPVLKPSYRPDWRNGRVIDIRPDLEALL